MPPPANIPLVELDLPPPLLNPAFKTSPKSDAFPVVAIVMKSITFVREGVPPAIKTPRVEFETAPAVILASVKSPKSVVLEVVANVRNSILFVVFGCQPPANTPLVTLLSEDPVFLAPALNSPNIIAFPPEGI